MEADKLMLSCSCGSIKGHVSGINPRLGNRIKCYCNDCRRFVSMFEEGKKYIDQQGGSEILQVPPSHVKIDEGKEHLGCLKLSDKGLHRWYSNCCKTPLFNTAGLKIPFVGIFGHFIEDEHYEAHVGPVLGGVFKDSSLTPIVNKIGLNYSKPRILSRMAFQLVTWKVSGKSQPNCLYESSGKAIVKPEIVKNIAS
ncbi:DUF6151 family protein [Marinomonas balearica]|uniref:CENP-V/GFA domain-containing protein n=1 Tax=Marinomonas balearica TaxID=491947 RepID=A0A4R6M669_9GAMM|nr:DUF6151 family protein [Marinomonas balearica]TDO96868.1 hypothetical protein DFP79_2637 [Marinomonas balearica]